MIWTFTSIWLISFWLIAASLKFINIKGWNIVLMCKIKSNLFLPQAIYIPTVGIECEWMIMPAGSTYVNIMVFMCGQIIIIVYINIVLRRQFTAYPQYVYLSIKILCDGKWFTYIRMYSRKLYQHYLWKTFLCFPIFL